MANVFSMVSDMFPRTAVGAVTGIGGTAGSLGGMLIALATGWLLETTGTYWLLFVFASSSYLVAWIIIQWLVPTIKPIPLEKLLPTDPSRQAGRH
jgi:ACS family hexuronate transporter-like MFS transporter